FQASLLCEMIERNYGFDKILGMLQGYRQGQTTAEVFHDVLHSDLPTFDTRFDAYLRERYQKPLAAIRAQTLPVPGVRHVTADWVERARADTGDFVAQLAAGGSLAGEHKIDEALPYLERAQRLFPEYTAEDSPYWLLAQIHKERGQIWEAVAELSALTALNENDYRANIEEADLREKLGDVAGAAAALDRAVYIYPMEAPLHTRLAALYSKTAQPGKAVRERRSE